MQKADFIISLEGGFHMRPAAMLSREALKFQSRVALQMNGVCYNGKSIFELLGMCAVKGSAVSLVTDGEDERAAFETLTALLLDMGVRKNEISESAE